MSCAMPLPYAHKIPGCTSSFLMKEYAFTDIWPESSDMPSAEQTFPETEQQLSVPSFSCI